MRGLDDKSVMALKSNPQIQELIDEINDANKNNIFVAIRDNYLTLYYDCLRIMDIRMENGKINSVDSNESYLGNMGNTKLNENNINIQDIEKIIEGIRSYETSNKKEKKVQHSIVVNNNKQDDTKWFCIDVEYQTTEYGRFDIIAISSERINGKYQIAIVELKADTSSIITGCNDIKGWVDAGSVKIRNINDWKLGRGSKITGHFSNFQGFLTDKESVRTLKKDIIESVIVYERIGFKNERFLDIYSKLKDINIDEDFEELPRIIFLNCAVNEKIESVKKYFKGAALNKGKYSILNVWDKLLIDNNIHLYSCVFRDEHLPMKIFSDLEISEAKNIFDEEAYK